MIIREFDPTTVVRNPAIMARMGEPDSEKVDVFVANFFERRDTGRAHQIQPGVVRTFKEKGKEVTEVIVGSHRLAACLKANRLIDKKDDPFLFTAVVVPATDEQALIDAIQENEIRVASSIFDRADSMQRLLDLGIKQNRIAKIFGVTEGSVSQTLAAQKCDKKLRKMVLDGDIEAEAAVILMRLEPDDTKRQQLIEECLRHRTKVSEIEASVETKAAIKEVAAKVEDAKSTVSALKEKQKDLQSKLKDDTKAITDLEKAQAKTKDKDDLERVRKEIADVKVTRKMHEDEAKSIQKELVATEKKVEKLKEAKATVVAPAKKKVSPEEVKRAAKAAGKDVKISKRSRADLIVFIEAWREDKEDPQSEAIGNVLGRLEEWLDGECEDPALRKSFKFNTLNEDEYAARKVSAKKAKK